MMVHMEEGEVQDVDMGVAVVEVDLIEIPLTTRVLSAAVDLPGVKVPLKSRIVEELSKGAVVMADPVVLSVADAVVVVLVMVKQRMVNVLVEYLNGAVGPDVG